MTQLTADDSCAKAGAYKYEVPDSGEGKYRVIFTKGSGAQTPGANQRHRILRQGQLGWLFRRGECGGLQHPAAGSGLFGLDFGFRCERRQAQPEVGRKRAIDGHRDPFERDGQDSLFDHLE